MNAFALAAALTFAGSIHCLGMCGGFAVAVAGAAGRVPSKLLAHQVLLHLGKATSYAFLGSLAGTVGSRLLAHRAFAYSERLLALVAGLAIVAAGLVLLGVGGMRGGIGRKLAPHFNEFVGPLYASRPVGFPLLVGIVMGFLPCPLVYAGLGAAAATGDPGKGAIVMAGVALGTIPALLLAGILGGAIPLAWRRGLARGAGVLLIAVGLVTAARGVVSHDHAGHQGHGAATGSPVEAPGAGDAGTSASCEQPR